MAMGGARSILFTSLAMNQALFFEALDEAFAARGISCAHLTFHERSHAYLEARGRLSFCTNSSSEAAPLAPSLVSSLTDFGSL